MNTYIFKGCERVMLEERTKILRNKETAAICDLLLKQPQTAQSSPSSPSF
jgi:hypothetical protein